MLEASIRQMLRSTRLISIFILFTCCYAVTAFALKSDNIEKIYIMGDYAMLNYKTGIHTFEGHVKVDQGTTHVLADRIQTTNNHHHEIKEVTAYGLENLAHYWTLPKVGDAEIHAHAKIIKFYPLSSNATLEQHAIVIQGNNSFRGEQILYNMNDETITIPASKKGRAVLIYDPESK